ncbi:MAG: hypothetical protein FWC00_01565 [Firmicutes bacterium]|nr:hypothetical protein [Bacillota bacterium]
MKLFKIIPLFALAYIAIFGIAIASFSLGAHFSSGGTGSQQTKPYDPRIAVRAEIQELISLASGFEQEYFAINTWNALMVAKFNALGTYGNNNSTIDDLETVHANLVLAKSRLMGPEEYDIALTYVRGGLEYAFNEINGKTVTEIDDVSTVLMPGMMGIRTSRIFQDSRRAVRDVLGNDDATLAELEYAKENLLNAFNGLVTITEGLRAMHAYALALYDTLNPNDFTVASWSAFIQRGVNVNVEQAIERGEFNQFNLYGNILAVINNLERV